MRMEAGCPVPIDKIMEMQLKIKRSRLHLPFLFNQTKIFGGII